MRFVEGAGIYLPDRDAIGVTAVDGSRIIQCYVVRSALNLVGGAGISDGLELARCFEEHRIHIELAAMLKHGLSAGTSAIIEVTGVDLMALRAVAAT